MKKIIISMNLKIAVLSGDGIGPEVILQAKSIVCYWGGF
jgi:isocitrate/isopropylmalate dehydrogenase